MSGDTYSRYVKGYSEKFSLSDEEARKKEVKKTRSAIHEIPKEKVDHTIFNKEVETADASKARLVIQKPLALKNYLVAVDASGSNHEIARHILQCGGFLLAPFGIMGVSVSFGFVFFSDHGDRKPEQDIDFIMPSMQGDDELTASMQTIHTQDGQDIPEMIECVMLRAAKDLPIEESDTTFALVTDSVAHGMGFNGDNECHFHVDWQESLKLVKKRFSNFVLIGCTDTKRYPNVSDLQAKFFNNESEKALNFIDLSSVENNGDRQRLVINALQFVAMRDHGLDKVEAYFNGLYIKLLEEGLRGQDTDRDARDRIARFMKYVDAADDVKKNMLIRIFAD